MLSRREFVMIGTGGIAAATAASRAGAQTPKRGGVLTLRLWDPPHFDHILAHWHLHRRVRRCPQELRAEPRLRLRRSTHRRLARSVTRLAPRSSGGPPTSFAVRTGAAENDGAG
jgi:hypothetical protein